MGGMAFDSMCNLGLIFKQNKLLCETIYSMTELISKRLVSDIDTHIVVFPTIKEVQVH